MIHILFAAAMAIFVVYFWLFKRSCEIAGERELKRFTNEVGVPWWITTSVLLIGGLAFWFADYSARIAIALAIVVWLFAAARRQDRRMETLGFAPEPVIKLIRMLGINLKSISQLLWP